MEFKPVPLKVVNKGDGVIEITLRVENGSLHGKMDDLGELIKRPCIVEINANTRCFVTKTNRETNQPLTRYEVDDRGVVKELKAEQAQLELEGLEQLQLKEEHHEIDVDIIDEYIISSPECPEYNDITVDIEQIVLLQKSGKNDVEIALDLDLKLEEMRMQLDDYRNRVAPHAHAWWNWKLDK